MSLKTLYNRLKEYQQNAEPDAAGGKAAWASRPQTGIRHPPSAVPPARCPSTAREHVMSEHVYKMIELTGSSPDSIEAACGNAIAKASESVRNIRWFTVGEVRGHVEDGKVAHWQVTVKLGFTLE